MEFIQFLLHAFIDVNRHFLYFLNIISELFNILDILHTFCATFYNVFWNIKCFGIYQIQFPP